ncbi:hypothetical protein [Flavobacterium enshiense]|uniref:Glycosyltransferase RgtA/B/C/D-like domain-containing protein n=1 Tax=Flavobacterium enshiense DK69 TaxID=1107311 RepID=A0A0A2MWX6_9FLAO|nr:hypothetical protein [Flavobacterium enshiense]KGO97172.1 hypothetical protein Q767_00780 [Flavobacterium enshiense DK69]
MIAGWKRHSEKVFLVFLSGYHLLFTFLTWDYFSGKSGDAAFYWFEIQSSVSKSFSDLFHYGSDFVLLLNYPFAKLLGLNIGWGFFIYSLIGYLGILQFYRLCQLFLNKKYLFKGFESYYLLLLLPNLHFWTAGLGKESLCFLFIATILLELAKDNFKSPAMLLSAFLLILIRPHIALLLLFSVAVVYFFSNKINLKQRILIACGSLVLFSGLFYMFLQLSKIKRFDFDRIKYFNEFSLLSFKNSGSYVPIIEYSYPYKIFTFYFRPFINEIPTVYGLALGLENVVVLLLHIGALLLFFLNYKKIDFPLVFKIILCFALLSGLLIVQRYSGLGIFARTKIMMQPFVLLVSLWIIAEVRSLTIDRVK